MYSGKAWKAEAFGEPEAVLSLQDDQWEAPAPGEILVDVLACGIGLPDLFMTQGHYPMVAAPPVRPGQEVCGRVIAVPEGSAFRVGDRIMGMTIYSPGWWRGGLADYALMQEKKSLPVPGHMSDEAAAGFTIAFRTAHAALIERVPVEAGQSVLVLGAAGSSGAATIQLAKALGAKVIAVASSQEKRSFCASIGADHVVDYRSENWVDQVRDATSGRGVDILFDPVGGETATRAIAALARYGRIALIGFASGEWSPLDAQDMVLRNYSAIGVFSGSFTDEENTRAFANLTDFVARGRVTTPLGRVFDFDQTCEAIASMRAPNAGKTVVRVAETSNSFTAPETAS